MNDVLKLAQSVVVAFAPAISGTVAKPDDWYKGLNKSPLNPPGWVFAPVWTALYALIGIAHNQYSKTETTVDKTNGEAIYALQLLLNATWSLAFFKEKSPRLALVNIVLLLISIVATMAAFGRVSKRSAWLLTPYLLWVCFATYLNAEICRLNPEA